MYVRRPLICSTSDVPRKGNVDRNGGVRAGCASIRLRTFPARGTWIEMQKVNDDA